MGGAGGESGVVSVQYLSGDAVWAAGARGEWSRELAESALAAIGGGADGTGDAGAGGGGYGSEARPVGTMEEGCGDPFAVLLRYADGFKATVLFLNGYVRTHSFDLPVSASRVLCLCHTVYLRTEILGKSLNFPEI